MASSSTSYHRSVPMAGCRVSETFPSGLSSIWGATRRCPATSSMVRRVRPTGRRTSRTTAVSTTPATSASVVQSRRLV